MIFNLIRVPKRSFVFLQQNKKFYICTQTAIRFLQQNTKFYSCTQTVIRFLQRNTKFYSCTETAILFHSEIRNLELYPNCHSFFDYKIRIFLKLFQNSHFLFDKKFKKSKVVSKLPLVS